MKPAKKKGRGGSMNPETSNSGTSNIVPIRGGAPVEVLSIDETEALKVHHEIQDLMKSHDEIYFKLAQHLHLVQQKKYYRKIDGGRYETFEDYIKSISVESRKARYLVQLWWWFGIEHKDNPDLMVGALDIGWSKAKELVSVVNKRNAEEWFSIARTKNVADFVDAVRIAKKKAAAAKKARDEAKKSGNNSESRETDQEGDAETPKPLKVFEPKAPKGMIPDDPEPETMEQNEEVPIGIDPPPIILEEIEKKKEEAKNWKRYLFSVHVDESDVVDNAFKCAEVTGESKHPGHLLSLICLHFMTFYGSERNMAAEWLAKIERATGWSIIAMDRRKDDIVYGADLVQELTEGDDNEGEQGVGDPGDGVGEDSSGSVDTGA